MLSKKSVKIISIILLAVILLMSVGNVVFAGVADQFNPDTSAIEGTGAKGVANTVLGALKWAGVAIAVGMLIFLGIKYVTSSPDGKANLKGQLGIYVLGFVFIVGATVIIGILQGIIPE